MGAFHIWRKNTKIRCSELAGKTSILKLVKPRVQFKVIVRFPWIKINQEV